ncbi:uncharacterized protein LOC143352263 isoform X1 [Halictus rubicundus]|uniref:uncharacterized protein LOC143352263 isoform X1 n=1 Tax=Halictus rubicundus TaxID=77578 RepID=UPI004034F7E7
MYQLALADSKLRHALNLGSHCGIVMFLTWLMTIIVLVCSLMCVKASATNEKDFLTLHMETEKKFPRKKSVTDIGPAYNCIRKHLQQTDVFQEKTKKMLRKELLELEILNSRINCINKLLKSETQSKWQRSRLPKVYYRPIDSSASK